MLIYARWILPVSSPPILNGALRIQGGLIVALGARKSLSGSGEQIMDLGDSVVFPGLVNAHAHLEHSHMATKPSSSTLGYTEWAKGMSTNVAGEIEKTSGIARAIRRLLEGGTTTVADHEHPDGPIIKTPMRKISFWEVLGSGEERAEESLLRAERRASEEGGFVSPHSLYAVHKNVLEKIFTDALSSVHLLESSEEENFFRTGAGPLADYVKERGGEIPFPETSPLRWLARHHRLGPKTLVIHGNYLNDEEMDLMAKQKTGVIHCPGSHRFFGHQAFPLFELKKRGIVIGLGTDSLASNESLSMLREMKILSKNFPSLSSEEILRMATWNAASLLGKGAEIGSLEIGKQADLAAVPFLEGTDPQGSLLQTEEVSFLMVGGNKLIKGF